MPYQNYYKGFKLFLELEKNLSKNSVEAYLRDIKKLDKFILETNKEVNILSPGNDFFASYIKWLVQKGVTATSQARNLSGIRSFYDYLMLEKVVDENPTELIDFPKFARKLPIYLTSDEIESMIGKIDQSTVWGFRNRVIIELLFACGLRVSELIGLEKAHIYFKEECILVTGKGNKQRLIPISKNALNLLERLIHESNLNVKTKSNLIFLNKQGTPLSRISVFTMIKDLAAKAGVRKVISPHTFRHSFATGLITNGADLRAVQSMLGHESITTTEIYTHLDRKYLQNVVDNYHPRSKKKKNDTL